MTYDPDVHHRRSIRLRSYDYRSSGAYFVTVCTNGKELILSEIVGETAQLTPMGEIVRNCLNEIPQHFLNAELDMHVIMPNHLHAILVIHPPVGATHASPSPASHNSQEAEDPRARHASPLQPGPAKQSLGAIVGSFKSACTKRINELRGTPGVTVWQRSFHEHIIRNDYELHVFATIYSTIRPGGRKTVNICQKIQTMQAMSFDSSYPKLNFALIFSYSPIDWC
jgi:REP element-mobilizing transposase RayT